MSMRAWKLLMVLKLEENTFGETKSRSRDSGPAASFVRLHPQRSTNFSKLFSRKEYNSPRPIHKADCDRCSQAQAFISSPRLVMKTVLAANAVFGCYTNVIPSRRFRFSPTKPVLGFVADDWLYGIIPNRVLSLFVGNGRYRARTRPGDTPSRSESNAGKF